MEKTKNSKEKSTKKSKNPFLNKPIEVIKIVRETKTKTPTSSGFHFRNEQSINYVDSDKGGKLFRSKRFEELIYSLDEKALKLLFYIALHIAQDSDQIQLYQKKVSELLGFEKSSFYSAIKTLKKNKIIDSKPKRGMYWVNPHFLFQGNRYAYFTKKQENQAGEKNVSVLKTHIITDKSEADNKEKKPMNNNNNKDTAQPLYGEF